MEAQPPSLIPDLDQIRSSFQLGAVLEGVAHLLAQHTVCVVDGVKGDGPQLVRVDLAVLVQHGLIGARIDDLTYQTAVFRDIAHQIQLPDVQKFCGEPVF